MKLYESFKEAVESVIDISDKWESASEDGICFTRDQMLTMGTIYDEACEPDDMTSFGTFEKSGEICRVSLYSGEITVLYAPEGSKYKEAIKEQERRVNELAESAEPIFKQMIEEEAEITAKKIIAAAPYSIDANGNVSGLEPMKLRHARLFRKPGCTVLPPAAGEAFVLYEKIKEASGEPEAVSDEKDKAEIAASATIFVWERLYAHAAYEADYELGFEEVPDFAWDDTVRARIANAARTLGNIKMQQGS